MKSFKAGGWIAGAAFVGVVILVAAWFLAISPTLATAADTREQTASQLNQNQLTQVKITKLQKQFAKLDEIKADLAAIQLQIPTTTDLAVYQQQLAGIAALHQVMVVSVSASTSAPVVPVEAAAAAAASAAAATDSSSGDATTPPAAAPIGIAGFSSIGVSLEVMGTYSNALAFLQDLQVGTQRLLLVTGLTVTSQDAQEAGGGKPATAPGDLDLLITGNLYVLSDTLTAPVTEPSPADTPAVTLPVPDPAKNPFVPLG